MPPPHQRKCANQRRKIFLRTEPPDREHDGWLTVGEPGMADWFPGNLANALAKDRVDDADALRPRPASRTKSSAAPRDTVTIASIRG